VLSRLVKRVTSIERYRTLAETARAKLAALGYDNVEVMVGDGLAGAPDRAPFDRIDRDRRGGAHSGNPAPAARGRRYDGLAARTPRWSPVLVRLTRTDGGFDVTF